jgi:tetratricopeptide (TPR) repeat protein
LGSAIKQDPNNPELRAALSQVHYDRKDYPAALAEADAALERDPSNKEAAALKHFSEDRIAPGGSVSASAGVADGAVAVPPDYGASRQDASPRIVAIIHKAAAARRGGDIDTPWKLAQQAMRLEPTSSAAQDFYKIVEKDRAKFLEARSSLGHDSAAASAGGETETAPKPVPSGPDPRPLVPIGAAGAALGLTAYALWRRQSDNPNIRGPMMAFAMTGLGATGAVFVGGVYMLSQSHGAADVGMYGTNRAPLLQDSPNVGLSPKKNSDCVEQLKNFYPQQQDVQQRRQGAIIILQPVLDKYGLNYEKFQSVFPRLLSSYVATCDVDPAGCQLRANKDDWAAAQASYGQIQSLDQKLQVLSGILAKLMDKCKVPGNDAKNRAAKKDGASLAKEEDSARGSGTSGPIDTIPDDEKIGNKASGEVEPAQSPAARALAIRRNSIPELNRTLAELDKTGQLPSNYITKDEARALGWKPGSDLAKIAPNKIIGGDIFGNNEGKLPAKVGRIWYEADLNYTSGRRGPARLLYSNDGLRYISLDHYATVVQISK